MAILQWWEPRVVHVGDTGPAFECVLHEENGRTLRDLTGHGCRFIFAYEGEDAHLVRHGRVDVAQGMAIYEDWTGGEYYKAGECLITCQVIQPDWSTAAPGQAGIVTSYPVMRRTVRQAAS